MVQWRFPVGVYTPRQIIHKLAPLLESVVLRLGPDVPDSVPSRDLLYDNLAANLSTEYPESTMPIPRSINDTSRREMANQAEVIGEALVQYVRETKPSMADPLINVHSPCEGHSWTAPVVNLLTSSRSNNQLMELYNEWQHQIVLLRDALLPFQNFSDVLLCIESENPLGLREFEEARSRFILQCLTRTVSRTALVDVAKTFTAPRLRSGGYGFQYAHGLVLPAFLAGCSSLQLLRYCSARLSDSATELLFDYEYANYDSAPRSPIPWMAATVSFLNMPLTSTMHLSPEVSECSLQIEVVSGSNGRRHHLLKLVLYLGTGQEKVRISVDVGQIARGRRYTYQVTNKPVTINNVKTSTRPPKTLAYKSARSILEQSGLVTSSQEDITYVIPAPHPILALALLGKLHPDKVIILGAEQSINCAMGGQKGFEPKFIIYGGLCGEGVGSRTELNNILG